jgi:acetyl esterase/lipase
VAITSTAGAGVEGGRAGGDPDFIVAAGSSAGGHLATLLGLTANDPAWQADLAGPRDRVTRQFQEIP